MSRRSPAFELKRGPDRIAKTRSGKADHTISPQNVVRINLAICTPLLLAHQVSAIHARIACQVPVRIPLPHLAVQFPILIFVPKALGPVREPALMNAGLLAAFIRALRAELFVVVPFSLRTVRTTIDKGSTSDRSRRPQFGFEQARKGLSPIQQQRPAVTQPGISATHNQLRPATHENSQYAPGENQTKTPLRQAAPELVHLSLPCHALP